MTLSPTPQTNQRSLNVAYACFAFCGLYVLTANMMDAGVGGQSAVLIGFLLAGLGLPGVVVMVCGTVLAVSHRRHRPLLVLCLANALFVAGIIIALSLEQEAFARVASWMYAAFTILVPLWWFVIGRTWNSTTPTS